MLGEKKKKRNETTIEYFDEKGLSKVFLVLAKHPLGDFLTDPIDVRYGFLQKFIQPQSDQNSYISCETLAANPS